LAPNNYRPQKSAPIGLPPIWLTENFEQGCTFHSSTKETINGAKLAK
jgi:hypothetical protein